MILLIPDTLERHSARQSAIDRIWRIEQDLRSLLSIHREGQRAFAKQTANAAGKSKSRRAEAGKQKIVRISA
jgi:hypothetical protein